MLNAKITGIASYVPEFVLTNEKLSQMVDTNDEWITTRVGIKERRILDPSLVGEAKGEHVGSAYMGTQAIQKLLNETGTDPKDVDLLICATTNPDYRFPSTASIMAKDCGLVNCYGFDVQAACAGFIVTMQMAAAYIRSGMHKKVIVCAAEQMSSMTNYEDRSTCPLFGDAAAAVLVEPTEEEGVGVIDCDIHVEGDCEHLLMHAGGSALPASHETVDQRLHFVYQEGRAVYKHAVMDMVNSSRTVMERNGLKGSDVKWFVPHQANLRIIEAVGSRLGLTDEQVLVNIQVRGNTSGASIPLCIDENKHLFKKGDKVLLTAFGAGFTWGSMYLVWAY